MKNLYETIIFAKEAHKGQLRKYTNEPYIYHSIAVAGLVASVTNDKFMIKAAILHDVVEDCNIDLAQIIDKFGYTIFQMVKDLTDISKPSDGKRSRRKTVDRLHIQKASIDSKTIKLADIIDNIKTIHILDPKFAKIYMNEKRMLLNVLKEGDQTLWDIANNLIENYYRDINEKE